MGRPIVEAREAQHRVQPLLVEQAEPQHALPGELDDQEADQDCGVAAFVGEDDLIAVYEDE
jgi:hypothetical protein